MKLKVLVIDQEQSLRELLRVFLVQLGHEVEAYHDPTACPLYSSLQSTVCGCPREKPCADVLFAGIDTPQIDAIALLKLQQNRGCKMAVANKAVMSSYLTSTLDQAIAELGCHHIGKPFRLMEIRQWLKECADRLAHGQPPPR